MTRYGRNSYWEKVWYWALSSASEVFGQWLRTSSKIGLTQFQIFWSGYYTLREEEKLIKVIDTGQVKTEIRLGIWYFKKSLVFRFIYYENLSPSIVRKTIIQFVQLLMKRLILFFNINIDFIVKAFFLSTGTTHVVKFSWLRPNHWTLISRYL